MKLKRLLFSFIIFFSIGCSNKVTNSSKNSSNIIPSSSSINLTNSSSTNSSTIIPNSTLSSPTNNDNNESTFSSSDKIENEIKHRIMLISGHGNGDPGAVYQNRQEASYNQEFVNLLTKEINKHKHYIEILHEPYPMKANEEANLIFSKSVDFVLNIHFNAGGGKGSEMIVPFNQTDFTFAYDFFDILKLNDFSVRETSVFSQNKTKRIQRSRNDKKYTYEDSFAVIRAGAKKNIPSYILEVEFIDNINQMKKYDQRKDVYISLLAQHIIEYFN